MKQQLSYCLLTFVISLFSSTKIYAQTLIIDGPDFICIGDTATYTLTPSLNPDIVEYDWLYLYIYGETIEHTDTSLIIIWEDLSYSQIIVLGLDSNEVSQEYGIKVTDVGGLPNIPFDITYFSSSDSVFLRHQSILEDSIAWDFGDGSPTQIGDSVYHQFEYNTLHEVCATSYSSCAVNVYCDTVCLDPISDFQFEINAEKDTALFYYTGTPGDSIVWDFGDGSAPMNGDTVQHTYTDNDFYEVCATVYSICGIDQYCDSIDACIPPQIDYAYTIEVKDYTLNLKYTGNPVDSVIWDISTGDSVYQGDSITHTYRATDSTISICISAYSPCGEDHFCDTISICDYLNASFSYEIIDSSNNTVAFLADWHNGIFVSWEMGDGAGRNGDTLIHTYGSNGIYEVCAFFYSGCETIIICDTVDLCIDPIAGFNYSLVPGSDSVLFNYTGSPADSLLWEFGDGFQIYGNTNSITHAYQQNAQFEVCVTTYDQCGEVTFCDSVDNRRIGLNALDHSNLLVYPNPSDNYFQIDGLTSEHPYSLYNSAGKSVLSGQLSQTENRLDASTIPSGIYFLRIFDIDNGFQTLKLIKM